MPKYIPIYTPVKAYLQNPLTHENIKIAFSSIQSNKLRAVLTIAIIAIGIMALVGILTAIDAIKGSITDQFTRMGANTFSIQSQGMFGNSPRERARKQNPAIKWEQALRFKESFNFPATISINFTGTGNGTVKFRSKKTNPNIRVLGIDENYLTTSGTELQSGRNFSNTDLQNNLHVCMIGPNLANKFFKKGDRPLDSILTCGNIKLKIIGILKAKGSSMGMNDDEIVLMPITTARQYFSSSDVSYRININPYEPKYIDFLVGESEGLFRAIRRLSHSDETDFDINKSDSLANMMIGNLGFVSIAATIIGLITLFGAAVGLMNIMLVSVSERTREIGTRKAIGANAQTIRRQFLYESIIIGQLGGFCGIILGILMGNIVSLLVGTHFVVPWAWVMAGVFLCFVVGLASGLIPAIKASKLDPIEALRYE